MRILFLLLFIWVCAFLSAQQAREIPKINHSIKLDGTADEDAWKDAAVFPLIMQTPVFMKDPSENTDVRIFFNDRYLYVSGKMFYTDISNMSRPGKQRDYFSGNCDWFGILLDSFKDNENMVAFFTNPNGLRFDAAVQNDASMGFEDVNLAWNTFWDVETRIDEDGWYAEMRIPVSSIRFQVENDTAYMGLSMFRYIPRKNETQTFPAIDPRHGDMASWKASLSAPVFMAGTETDLPAYITPYAIGGYERIFDLNETETAWELNETPKYNAGLDAKLGITNNLTLDLTVNTDFAQVEADDQQINLTRYSLYFPEKRPFFLEKSDVFNFDYLGGQNLFYSRRIGIYDEESVPIIGGARLTGRLGTWDIGLLDMQTARKGDISGENFGVIRTKRNILNPGSYIGAMLTSRTSPGSFNYAYGIDALVHPFGDDYLTLRWSQTFENGALNKFWSENPTRLLARWERRNLKGWSYDLLYTWSGKDFNPGVGFELIDNYYGTRGTLKYGWLPEDENSVLRTHNISNTTLLLYNSEDRSLQSIMSMATWEYSTRKGYSGNINLRYNKEIIHDTLEFSKTIVAPGNYNFFDIMLVASMKPGTWLGGMLISEIGQFYDGWRFSLNLQPMFNLSPSLDINPSYRFDRVGFAERKQGFTNHILGIKALLMISTTLSFTSFVQYNTDVKTWLINARFRYNPREGNDFYIVYNEGLNTDLYRESPVLPRSESRVLMLKYTYTFGF